MDTLMQKPTRPGGWIAIDVVPHARRDGLVLDPLRLEHVAHVAQRETAALFRDVEEKDEPSAARRLAGIRLSAAYGISPQGTQCRTYQ
jgi:hypothetical protein